MAIRPNDPREDWEEEAIRLAQEKTKDHKEIEINTLAIVNELDDYTSEYIHVPAYIMIPKAEMTTPL